MQTHPALHVFQELFPRAKEIQSAHLVLPIALSPMIRFIRTQPNNCHFIVNVGILKIILLMLQADKCGPCLPDEYSFAGAAICTPREPCKLLFTYFSTAVSICLMHELLQGKREDFEVVYTECIDGKRNRSLEPIMPHICEDRNMAFSKNTTFNLPCAICPPGTYDTAKSGLYSGEMQEVLHPEIFLTRLLQL